MSTFRFEENVVDLEQAVRLLRGPDPSLVDITPCYLSYKRYLGAGLEFICELARESYRNPDPQVKEANQSMAEEVWSHLEMHFDLLEAMHQVDRMKARLEIEMKGSLN